MEGGAGGAYTAVIDPMTAAEHPVPDASNERVASTSSPHPNRFAFVMMDRMSFSVACAMTVSGHSHVPAARQEWS